jgi:hypothetical protein
MGIVCEVRAHLGCQAAVIAQNGASVGPSVGFFGCTETSECMEPPSLALLERRVRLEQELLRADLALVLVEREE